MQYVFSFRSEECKSGLSNGPQNPTLLMYTDTIMSQKQADIKKSQFSLKQCYDLPVSINKAGIDVVRAIEASDWLQAHTGGLIWHDVYQPVLELVAGQVGCHKSGGVSFSVRQAL